MESDSIPDLQLAILGGDGGDTTPVERVETFASRPAPQEERHLRGSIRPCMLVYLHVYFRRDGRTDSRAGGVTPDAPLYEGKVRMELTDSLARGHPVPHRPLKSGDAHVETSHPPLPTHHLGMDCSCGPSLRVGAPDAQGGIGPRSALHRSIPNSRSTSA
jgi:hypothetical protein